MVDDFLQAITMPLNIKDKQTHDLARRLASATGETLTQAVRVAVEERLKRVRARGRAKRTRLADRLDEIALHCASLPVIDHRTEDEILGYDERGIPR